mmetsp:Transcript_24254/g.64033  ORF Transcript_24254/g.64033 Transcript_24254/m.64033 type:complete len:261 (-) Transcript_24254:271-1053(-)
MQRQLLQLRLHPLDPPRLLEHGRRRRLGREAWHEARHGTKCLQRLRGLWRRRRAEPATAEGRARQLERTQRVRPQPRLRRRQRGERGVEAGRVDGDCLLRQQRGDVSRLRSDYAAISKQQQHHLRRQRLASPIVHRARHGGRRVVEERGGATVGQLDDGAAAHKRQERLHSLRGRARLLLLQVALRPHLRLAPLVELHVRLHLLGAVQLQQLVRPAERLLDTLQLARILPLRRRREEGAKRPLHDLAALIDWPKPEQLER